jgi:quinol-cytochrome oxidoreductase complex cytochrome b subunit
VDPARRWRTATRVAFWIVAALFVVLIATGIGLSFRYRPTVTRPYASVTGLEPRSPITLRAVHRLAAALFVPAVGALAIASIGLLLARRKRAPIAFPLLAGVATLAAAFTGYLLPWDQLSLWAVTVGSDMRGYGPILRHHGVKFVILGSSEIDVGTFSRWFWTHTVVLPVVIVAMLIALALTVRRRGDYSQGSKRPSNSSLPSVTRP